MSPEERPFSPEMTPEPWREAEFVPPWPAPKPPRLMLHLGLLLATVVTTVIAGAIQQGVNPLSDPGLLYKGIPFSFTLLLILGTHEMGHYLVSRRHHLDVTLPYFIPAPPIPFIIGTFGAFIRIRSPIKGQAGPAGRGLRRAVNRRPGGHPGHPHRPEIVHRNRHRRGRE